MAYSTSPYCMHLQALIISIGLLLGLASMSMLVAGSAEEAPSSRIELINVDAFTREELISRDDGTTTTKVEARHFGHDSYLVELKMEVFSKNENKMVTKSFWVVADTGSDVVWRKQQFKYYIDSMPCDCVKDVSKTSECCSSKVYIFNRTYGHGKKAAKGFMCHEKVTLSPFMTDRAIRLGFAIDYDDHLLPGSAAGIVGLNRGQTSLLGQLKVTKFSYCLSKPTKPDQRNGKKKTEPEPEPERKSFFWFGGDKRAAAGTWLSTPLVKMPASSDRYHIALLGISIFDGEYKELRQEYFKHKSKQGDGVMFVDSGCSHTFLETRVFGELKKLLAGELVVPTKKDEFIANEFKGYTCFPDTPDKRPKLALHFKPTESKRYIVPIPWDNYVVWNKTESKYCLTIYPTSGESIMGNILQHDIRMHFDLDKEELSFKPVADCTMEP